MKRLALIVLLISSSVLWAQTPRCNFFNNSSRDSDTTNDASDHITGEHTFTGYLDRSSSYSSNSGVLVTVRAT